GVVREWELSEIANSQIARQRVLREAPAGVVDRRRASVDAGHGKTFARREPQIVARAATQLENLHRFPCPGRCIPKQERHYQVERSAIELPAFSVDGPFPDRIEGS